MSDSILPKNRRLASFTRAARQRRKKSDTSLEERQRLHHATLLREEGIVFGSDSRHKHGSKDAERYNGIFWGSYGFAAHFGLEYTDEPGFWQRLSQRAQNWREKFALPEQPKRLLVVPIVSHNPDNLGTYDEETGEYVLQEEDLIGHTYMPAALSAHAPYIFHQGVLTDHFRKMEELMAPLSLSGKTHFIPDETGEGRLVVIYRSVHIDYAIVEKKRAAPDPESGRDTEYDVYYLEGPGKLEYGGADYVGMDPVRAAAGGYKKLKSGLDGPYEHSELATRVMTEDWERRRTLLWNGLSLSDSRSHRIKQEFYHLWRTKGYRAAVTGVLTALLVSTISGAYNGASLSSLFGASTILSGAGAALAELVLDTRLLKGWNAINRGGDASARAGVREEGQRNYAGLLFNRKGMKFDRPIRKMDKRFGGKAVRLKAHHHDSTMPSTIHRGFDLEDPVDPAKLNPAMLGLATIHNSVFGAVHRHVSDVSSVYRFNSGLASLIIDGGLEAAGNTPAHNGHQALQRRFVRSNKTTIYMTLNQAFNGAAEGAGKDGARGVALSKELQNCFRHNGKDDGEPVVVKIEIDRKKSLCRLSTIAVAEFSRFLNEDCKIETGDSNRENALRRLRGYMGLEHDPKIAQFARRRALPASPSNRMLRHVLRG